MTKQEQLEKAIRIAVRAHVGQFDKGGMPYILHPLHLMHQLMFDIELATIAVLHDVVEDSDYTIPQLRERGFGPRVLNAVELLTHDPKVKYDDYIEKISGNYDAVRVKRKDLEHNSDLTRLKNKDELTKKDLDRTEKYIKAFIKLGHAKKQYERK